MRITKYDARLTDELQCILVKTVSKNYPAEQLNTPKLIVEMMNTVFDANHLPEEHVWLISLNTSQKITGITEISHGNVNSSIMSPREIFQRALLLNATSIVIVHNHPSGSTTPSQCDFASCQKLKDAGRLVDVCVNDFIIVGHGNDYYSFHEMGVKDKN